MIFSLEPLVFLVVYKELIELLALKLELVLPVLVERLLVSDGVILSLEEGLECHHHWLEVRVIFLSSKAIVSFPPHPFHIPFPSKIEVICPRYFVPTHFVCMSSALSWECLKCFSCR